MSDIFDKAKGLLSDNAEKVDEVVDKVAKVVDDTTGGKHADQIERGAAKAKEALRNLAGGAKEMRFRQDAPSRQGAGGRRRARTRSRVMAYSPGAESL